MNLFFMTDVNLFDFIWVLVFSPIIFMLITVWMPLIPIGGKKNIGWYEYRFILFKKFHDGADKLLSSFLDDLKSAELDGDYYIILQNNNCETLKIWISGWAYGYASSIGEFQNVKPSRKAMNRLRKIELELITEKENQHGY